MQEKEIKSTQIGKGGIKWSLFSDNLSTEEIKKIPTKKIFFKVVYEFSKIPGYKEPNIKCISMC